MYNEYAKRICINIVMKTFKLVFCNFLVLIMFDHVLIFLSIIQMVFFHYTGINDKVANKDAFFHGNLLLSH